MSIHPLEGILHPQSIAVVGASGDPTAMGFNFLSHLLEYGYRGKIYPVNPKYQEILGLKCYPGLKDIPGSVDYVISSVPAAAVPSMLDECSQKGVKAVHLFTGRFSETGHREAAELEQEVLRQAKQKGIHLIGPNCMGVYYPKQRISWGNEFPREAGSVGLASQSGNVAGEIIQSAALRGIRFSKTISYGNAIDFNESDYLDYLSQDLETKLILMYIEGVNDGRRFFSSLRQAAATKPVIIIKGGRGESGTRAAASHTASLAGSTEIWETAITQTGAVSAGNFNELIDLATSFYFLPPIKGRRVGVAGGAGGTSVLAADECEEAGLDVVPLPIEIRDELKTKGVDIWDWIGNPADMTIRTDTDFRVGTILQMMAKNENFDFLIAIMYGPHRSRQEEATPETYLKSYELKESNQKPILAVLVERNLSKYEDNEWSRKLMYEVGKKLIAANIPFYPTIGSAAKAVSKLIDYYQKRG